MVKGVFIVIEGTDGSGKGTQFKLLKKRLIKEGHDVATFDFPQYEKPSSHFVKEYLNGNYGTVDEVGPYTGSLFFALDRYQAATEIKQALEAGKVVLANRFTGSNMAHQGTKFNNQDERKGYFIWLDNLEFSLLKIPRPDINFVLRVPAETAQQLVDQKEERSYTDKKRDIHEADLSHLQKSVEVYDDLCDLFPNDFQRIDCVRGGKLMSIENVHKLVWEKIEPIIPSPFGATNVMDSKVATTPTPQLGRKTTNPYLNKMEGKYEITAEGKEFLKNTVTNEDGNVYGFKDNLSSTTIATAMARLSRRRDDMRVTILDEFANAAGKDSQLLQQVITAYGDDSVQQLVGQHIVVEDASNLLAKKLEWGRLASYLEQPTRYTYFDQTDENGKYKYFTPSNLKPEVKASYEDAMDAIFKVYSVLVRELTNHVRKNSNTPKDQQDNAWMSTTRAQACDAIRLVLPVATKSTVGIFASGQALESLIMHLLSDDLPEAYETGQKILKEARKVTPEFLEQVDKPERGGATIAYGSETRESMKKITEQILPVHHAGKSKPVQLTDVWPRNELDVVPDMLYEFSNSSLQEIRDEVSGWTYDKKLSVFDKYIGKRLNRRHRPGRALEKIHYSFDLMCDYGIFRDLQRHRMVDDLEWQTLTPRYGYDTSTLVEEAGLTDLYEQCFDISLKLHSYLTQAGYTEEAQYATLLGHNMRWKVTYNAREAFHIHELRTSPQSHPGCRKLAQKMHEAVKNVHPNIAEAMKFVNQNDTIL